MARLLKTLAIVLVLCSQAHAGNELFRYIDKSCTHAGLGDSPTCAASDGAHGAANTVSAVTTEINTHFPSGLRIPNGCFSSSDGTGSGTCTTDQNVYGFCVGCSGGEIGVQTLTGFTDGTHRFQVEASGNTAGPEICGDGIDDNYWTSHGGTTNGTKGSCPGGYHDAVIGLGCDKDCATTNDEDHDGYPDVMGTGAAGTAIDCDPYDRTIYPGIYTAKGCSAGSYRYCDVDGVYKTAPSGSTASGGCTSTALCEATGTGHCYYISPASGSDSSGAGTKASPWKTLGKVGGGQTATGLPSSPTTLAPGDVVYMMDGGQATDTYTDAEAQVVIANFGISGTSSNHIKLKRYPGATVVFAPGGTSPQIQGDGSTGVLGMYVNSDYIDFENLEWIPAGTGMFIQGANHIHLWNMYFHDAWALNGNNNNQCLYFSGTNYTVVDHSFFQNCNAASGNATNVGPIMWLDNNLSGTGKGTAGLFNIFWMDHKQDDSAGYTYREKHGVNAADCDANGEEAMYSKMLNMNAMFVWNGSCLHAKYNLGVNTSFGGVFDGGEDNCMEDEILENNTMSGGKGPAWGPSYQCTTDHFDLQKNIINDVRSSWVNGNSEGIWSISGYGSDAQYDSIKAHSNLLTDYNGLYAQTTLQFCFFCQASGAGGPGPAGNEGAFYTFSNLKTTESLETHSQNIDPALSSGDFDTAVSQYAGWGYHSGFDVSTTTTTSSTTTTTTSSSTTTTLGPAYGRGYFFPK